MSTRIRIPILCGVLIVCVPAGASADWHFGAFLGRTFQGDTTLIDHEQAAGNGHWNLGGVVTLIGSGPFGVEGLLIYTPGFFEQDDRSDVDDVPGVNIVDSRTLALMGNAVLALPQKRNEYGLRPMVSGGIGLLHASATDSLGLTPVRVNLPGYNIGGGAAGFLTDRTGLRFDLRYVGTLKAKELKPGDEPISVGAARLSYWTASVAVVIRY